MKLSYLGICYLLFIPISIVKALLTSSHLGHVRVFGLPLFYIPLLYFGISIFLHRPYIPVKIYPLLILFLLGFFNIYLVQDLYQWLPYSLMPLIYIIFTSGMSRLNIKQHNDLVVIFLTIFSLYPIVSPFLYALGLNQYIFAPLSSLGVNRNLVSIIYAFLAVFSFSKSFINRNYILPFSLFLLATLLTFSRATWVYLLCSIIVCLFLNYWYGLFSFRFSPYLKKITLITLFIFLLISFSLFFSGMLDYFFVRVSNLSEIGSIFNFLDNIEYGAGGGRKQLLMRGSLHIFYEYPLFGVGAGQSWLNLPEFVTNVDRGGSSHSLLLRILAEYGLIGFSTILIFYLNIARSLIVSLGSIPYHLKPFSIAASSLFISLPVISLGSEYPLTSVLFWYLYAISLSLTRFSQSSSSP